MQLYHAEIKMPDGFVQPRTTVKVNYGPHARRESFLDRYGVMRLPDTINLGCMRVIEVGMVNGRIAKILFRGSYDREKDMCIVLVPNGNKPWFAKTVWFNMKNDLHKTLDRSKYIH